MGLSGRLPPSTAPKGEDSCRREKDNQREERDNYRKKKESHRKGVMQQNELA